MEIPTLAHKQKILHLRKHLLRRLHRSQEQPRSMILASENERIPPERGGKVTGFRRKTPEIDGKWKQYADRNFLDFFLVTSRPFPAEMH